MLLYSTPVVQRKRLDHVHELRVFLLLLIKYKSCLSVIIFPEILTNVACCLHVSANFDSILYVNHIFFSRKEICTIYIYTSLPSSKLVYADIIPYNQSTFSPCITKEHKSWNTNGFRHSKSCLKLMELEIRLLTFYFLFISK